MTFADTVSRVFMTPNFTYEELTCTNTGLPNDPPPRSHTIACLKAVARILQQVRDTFGKPIYINSGYRSPLVNAKVGGVRNSFHVKGCAVDIATRQYDVKELATLEGLFSHWRPIEFIKYDTFWHLAFDISKLGTDGDPKTWQQEYPDLIEPPAADWPTDL